MVKYAIIGIMNTKILDQLEFNKVKDQFTEYLQTEQAQAELRDLVPMTNPERIQNQFTEIQENGWDFRRAPWLCHW